jgi:hypothetical protein
MKKFLCLLLCLFGVSLSAMHENNREKRVFEIFTIVVGDEKLSIGRFINEDSIEFYLNDTIGDLYTHVINRDDVKTMLFNIGLGLNSIESATLCLSRMDYCKGSFDCLNEDHIGKKLRNILGELPTYQALFTISETSIQNNEIPEQNTSIPWCVIS